MQAYFFYITGIRFLNFTCAHFYTGVPFLCSLQYQGEPALHVGCIHSPSLHYQVHRSSCWVYLFFNFRCTTFKELQVHPFFMLGALIHHAGCTSYSILVHAKLHKGGLHLNFVLSKRFKWDFSQVQRLSDTIDVQQDSLKNIAWFIYSSLISAMKFLIRDIIVCETFH